MPRPRPLVMLEWFDEETQTQSQLLAAGAIWAVFYQGSPVNIKFIQASTGMEKYRKTAFSTRAPAFNLCDRLNKHFQTNEFTVHKLLNGPKVYP